MLICSFWANHMFIICTNFAIVMLPYINAAAGKALKSSPFRSGVSVVVDTMTFGPPGHSHTILAIKANSQSRCLCGVKLSTHSPFVLCMCFTGMDMCDCLHGISHVTRILQHTCKAVVYTVHIYLGWWRVCAAGVGQR